MKHTKALQAFVTSPCRFLTQLDRKLPLGTLGLHFIILFSGDSFLYLVHLGLYQKTLAELSLVVCRLCISCLTSFDLRNHYIGKFWGNYLSYRKDFMCITSDFSRGIRIVILAFRMVVISQS